MIRQNAPAAIYTVADTTGVTGSTVFTLTQLDFNTLLVRQYGTMTGGGATSTSTFAARVQTSPDGGTTFYDLANFPAQYGTTAVGVGSAIMAVIGGLKQAPYYIGTTAGSATLGSGAITQVPIFRTMKVIYTYGGPAGSGGLTVDFLPVDIDIH